MTSKKKPYKDLLILYRPPTLPPQEQEDWESEIQEVTVPDWEKMCFGVRPYGKENLFQYHIISLNSTIY